MRRRCGGSRAAGRSRRAPRAAPAPLLWLPVLGTVLTVMLGGCGSASAPSAPTGVDGLVIPTPAIDPHDFVRGIDNRWLPLRAGSQWIYSDDGQTVDGGTGTLTVRVVGTARVDGVTATRVESTVQGVTAGETTVDYYAQDTAGNVWWLGREGQWRAGEDGAQAGLAMPAHPRYGDGWREAYRPGVVADRATVTDVDDAFSVDGVRYTHVLDLSVTSDLSPGVVRERSYVAGVGLVRSYAADGPAELLELTSGP